MGFWQFFCREHNEIEIKSHHVKENHYDAHA